MPPDAPTLRPRILLVGDSKTMLKSLVAYARVAGFDPLCAGDGLRAVGMLQGGFRPALVVTDIDLPWLDGLQLIRFIRENESLAGTQVVVYSGSPPPPGDGGADRWLFNPDPIHLMTTIRELGAAARMIFSAVSSIRGHVGTAANGPVLAWASASRGVSRARWAVTSPP